MKKKGCKFCKLTYSGDCNGFFLRKFIPFGRDKKAFGINAFISDEKDRASINIWLDDGYTGDYIADHYIPIRFCPFCGRDLKKEKKL